MRTSEYTAGAQDAVAAWAPALPRADGAAGEHIAGSQEPTALRSSTPPAVGKSPPADRSSPPTPEEAKAIVESGAFRVLLDIEPRLSAFLGGRHGFDEQTMHDILAIVRDRWMTRLHRGLVIKPDKVVSYLYAIAGNAATDHQRRAWRRREVLTGLSDWDAVLSRPEYERSAEDVVTSTLVNEELLAKVQSLPHMQRRVIELLFLKELTVHETADLLDIQPETAARYRRIALKALRNMYAHASPEAGNKP
ncbi:RNA polymerase sigma factor [Streptomyces sp. NPDC089424]|uniref:RNA polymerase sigma factor n=1 Tax=Streptomyces sp. NPDC089424 TaxID=3365917 RepID=UPI003808438B